MSGSEKSLLLKKIFTNGTLGSKKKFEKHFFWYEQKRWVDKNIGLKEIITLKVFLAL